MTNAQDISSIVNICSEKFDICISPSVSLQTGINNCPDGGSILLLPGIHNGQIVIDNNKEINIFGRGIATIELSIISNSKKLTIDGVNSTSNKCIFIKSGCFNLQNSKFINNIIYIGNSNVNIINCSIYNIEINQFTTGNICNNNIYGIVNLHSDLDINFKNNNILNSNNEHYITIFNSTNYLSLSNILILDNIFNKLATNNKFIIASQSDSTVILPFGQNPINLNQTESLFGQKLISSNQSNSIITNKSKFGGIIWNDFLFQTSCVRQYLIMNKWWDKHNNSTMFKYATNTKFPCIIFTPNTFTINIAPGESVQNAINKCPKGGNIRLLPGLHKGPIFLDSHTEINIFGKCKALLYSDYGSVITSNSNNSTIDGLLILTKKYKYDDDFYAININSGILNIQHCNIASFMAGSIIASGINTNVNIINCILHSGKTAGAYFNDGCNGCIRDCLIYDSLDNGIVIINNNLSKVSIIDNEIKNCSNNGILICNVSPLVQNNTIYNCNIGISILDHNKAIIENNEIWNVNKFGIYIYDKAKPFINSNIIRNGIIGININGLYTNPNIQNNKITDNTYACINIYDDATPMIRYNTLYGIQKYNNSTLINNNKIRLNYTNIISIDYTNKYN